MRNVFRIPRRNLSTSLPKDASKPKRERGKDYVGMTLFGSLVVGTFGLGSWQANRYYWKEALIMEREAILGQEPKDLLTLLRDIGKEVAIGFDIGGGESPTDVKSLHFSRVNVRGTFDHTNEILIGPRVPPKRAHGGGMDIAEVGGESDGFIVVTPLILEDPRGEGNGGDQCVLVNRGWIPNPAKTKFKTEPALRFTTGVVEITGVVHPPEKPRMFSPPNDVAKRRFLWFDPIAAAQAVGIRLPSIAEAVTEGDPVCPLIINQTESCNPGMFPVMKDISDYGKFHVGTETHATYAGTWFSLSALGVVMTYLRFLR